MKSAIVIVDLLEDFFKEDRKRLKEHRETLVNNVNKLVKEARNKNIPIIWIRQEYKADLSDAPLRNRKSNIPITIENTEGSQILSELDRAKSDYEVIKKRYSAFFNTNLDELLKKLGIDTVIVLGINTHACVRMTAIDAYQRDYEVILALDCINSYDGEHHRVTLEYLTSRGIATAKTNTEIFTIL